MKYMVSFQIDTNKLDPKLIEEAAKQENRSRSGYLRHLLLIDLRARGLVPDNLVYTDGRGE